MILFSFMPTTDEIIDIVEAIDAVDKETGNDNKLQLRLLLQSCFYSVELNHM